ncbi:hypothetical protein ACFL0V_04195, partial [Nanoarchaeota archaeon]
MKVQDKVRNLSADLSKLAEFYDLVLNLKKKKNLENFLLKQFPTSPNTVKHAMRINLYCKKHKKDVRSAIKKSKPHLDEAFFYIAEKVFEHDESKEAIKSVQAILTELEQTVNRQRIIINDLTHVEKDEFSHLADWGLKHSIGGKKRVHITDFVHKLEKKIDWKHDNDAHNTLRYRQLVEDEPDHATRTIHLYIISLVKLKHQYEYLETVFNTQLRQVKEQEKLMKRLEKGDYGKTVA